MEELINFLIRKTIKKNLIIKVETQRFGLYIQYQNYKTLSTLQACFIT